MKAVQRQRGFTLVEVLVALAVMALLAGMAWRGVDGIVRTRDASQARLEDTLRLNAVMAQWQTDLAAIQDVSVVPAILFDGAHLRLTRRTESGMQVVVWSLVDTSNGHGRWLRWAGPVVTSSAGLREAWISSQALQGTEPAQVLSLDNVSQWLVYFYQGNAWGNAQSTGEVAAVAPAASAPLQVRQALPNGVRILLSLPSGTLQRDVYLGS